MRICIKIINYIIIFVDYLLGIYSGICIWIRYKLIDVVYYYI